MYDTNEKKTSRQIQDKGADLEVLRESQRRRRANTATIDEIASLDRKWRQACYEQEQLSKQFNQLNKEVAKRRKAGEDLSDSLLQAKAVKTRVQEIVEAEASLRHERDTLLSSVGNIVLPFVPVSDNEADNEVFHESPCCATRRGLTQEDRDALLGHAELVRRLGLANLDAGRAAAGDRAYYLLQDGVLLNQALISYGLHFLKERGWTAVQTPYWLNAESMAKCAQLSQFDEELYRLSTDNDDPAATSKNRHRSSSGGGVTSSSKYLIATSEQALCAMHQDEWLEPGQVPIRYAGLSTCFRREAGSHGKDTLGLFRVHQFDKVEQFAITAPNLEDSQRMFDSMVRNVQDFYGSLNIPYRLVRIVSGALNASAACKVDLEAWFPAGGTFRELVSASNCTDYQARRLNVRMRLPNNTSQPASSHGAAQHASSGSTNSAPVHMLNATLVATQRTLCCILENGQTSEGVKRAAGQSADGSGTTREDFADLLRTVAGEGLGKAT